MRTNKGYRGYLLIADFTGDLYCIDGVTSGFYSFDECKRMIDELLD